MPRKRTPLWLVAWHETVCWFMGHRWKSSRRETEDGWKHVAWWHNKCRRCRMRVQNDRWDPWYKVLWWASKNGLGAWWISVDVYRPRKNRKAGRGYLATPWGVWVVHSLFGSPCFGFQQFWGHLAHSLRLPMWPCWPVGDLADWLANWTERHSTRYVWIEPQTKDPAERGYWIIDGLADTQMKIRFMVYDGVGATTTGQWDEPSNGTTWTASV